MELEVTSQTALRVTCSRSALAAALAVVARAVSSRGAVQVLGGIRLQAEDGRLTLAATDMEISLRASIAGDTAGEAAVVVPGRLLADLVRLLPDESVTLTHEEGEGVVTVVAGSHTSRLNVYSAEDFPRLPSTEVQLHEIDCEALLATIDKVGRAASRDESRPVLTGVLVRFEGDKLVMAATDSYRLAVKDTALSTPGPDLDAIIPARALQELARIAAGRRVGAARPARELRDLLGRGRLADEPSHRRSVPELQAALAGDVRDRVDDTARAAARGRASSRAHGAAKRAPPTALRGR